MHSTQHPRWIRYVPCLFIRLKFLVWVLSITYLLQLHEFRTKPKHFQDLHGFYRLIQMWRVRYNLFCLESISEAATSDCFALEPFEKAGSSRSSINRTFHYMNTLFTQNIFKVDCCLIMVCSWRRVHHLYQANRAILSLSSDSPT